MVKYISPLASLLRTVRALAALTTKRGLAWYVWKKGKPKIYAATRPALYIYDILLGRKIAQIA